MNDKMDFVNEMSDTADSQAQVQALPEALVAVVELAGRRGVSNIKALLGCHEMDIDAEWWIAVNGHSEPTECSRDVTVAPYTVYMERCGWPAGIIDAGGGAFVGPGTEEAFIAAVRAAAATVVTTSEEEKRE